MLKVGIIGLGDISKKAYLPVLSTRKDIEFHICTRNETSLQQAQAQYRFQHLHTSLDALIAASPDCAFVNTATDVHFDIVKALLNNGIHVYVDKPITMHYQQSKELVELAEEKQRILMVGFNRRYAPVYMRLKEVNNPTMIVMQKNRTALPDPLKRFIVEDFIHVVDTLRYLFPYPIDQLLVNGMQRDNLLHHVSIQFIAASGETAIGIMNRDGGTTEEKVEVMSPAEKRVAINVADLYIHKNKTTTHEGDNDWQSTLNKRGFESIIDDFLNAVRNNGTTKIAARDALVTHEICEAIVRELISKGMQ
jgi:virulence factor